MARKHTLIIASLFAFAAIAGGVSLAHTLSLGAASKHANDRAIATRTRQLNRFEQSLHRQLAAAPVVKAPVVQAPVATAPQAPAIVSAPQSQAQRVVYVRPKPIIVHKHRAGGEYEAKSDGQGEGGSDD